jgi:hypothetical protein
MAPLATNKRIRLSVTKRRIIAAISIAAALALIHFFIRLYIPSFSVLYDGSARPDWISYTIDAEFMMHLLYLGALFAFTGRSIPSLNKPKYSDDGTESLFNSTPPVDSTDWTSILAAWACVPIYATIWMLAYGYL